MTPQSTLKTTPKANHNKKQGAKSAKASPSAPVATYSGRGNQTIVRKSNDLIQNAMYSLSLSQQKLMLHIFAMIKPSDTELPRYEMSIYEFLKLCGVDPHNGSMYKQVKKTSRTSPTPRSSGSAWRAPRKSRCSAGFPARPSTRAPARSC